MVSVGVGVVVTDNKVVVDDAATVWSLLVSLRVNYYNHNKDLRYLSSW